MTTHSSSDSKPLSSNDTFKALKTICVPLLSNSLLRPENIPTVSSLLSQLDSLLAAIQADDTSQLSPSTIEYVFFPLSHLLRRNAVSSVPDVIMEKLMCVLARLVERWWWTCSVEVWEQLLMFSAAIFCGVDAASSGKGKGKSKARDEETMLASARCLRALLRRREEREGADPETRFTLFVSRARDPKVFSILGQTLTTLLDTAQSAHRALQTASFDLIQVLIDGYFPDAVLPSVVPGVVSAMTKVALGRRENKGWSNGDIVVRALEVMRAVILGAVRDEVCVAEGAVRTFTRLDELNDAVETTGPSLSSEPPPSSPFSTPRTSVWLAATATQLTIALNALSPLLHHPNPIVPSALALFSYIILSNTAQTLPDAQQHLLLYLLSLSTHPSSPEVQKSATTHLVALLSPPSPIHHPLLQVLSRLMRDRLTSLPQLIPAAHNSTDTTAVERIAKQVAGAARLSDAVPPISDGISTLLGPIGGVEKWGWSFVSALRFDVPRLFVSVTPAIALLEGGGAPTHAFPELSMQFATGAESRTAQEALGEMFRALGEAGGAEGGFAVEWFVGVGRKGRTAREVSALWCAMRLLEGMGRVSLGGGPDAVGEDARWPGQELKKICRWVVRTVAEFWESVDDDEEDVQREEDGSMEVTSDARMPVQYVKGLNPLITLFDAQKNNTTRPPLRNAQAQHTLHKVMSLRLLSTAASILRADFPPLLLPALYPILHSLTSPSPSSTYLSSTALATLHHVASVTGYATPSNLLLANFDYALDGAARRLDRRNLDPAAAGVLGVLVRLVGADIVRRAGDVVEACFERLDEYHGYGAVVEGLVEVLGEVVRAVAGEAEVEVGEREVEREMDRVSGFVEWYRQRRRDGDDEDEEYGPAPREDWANLSEKGKTKEPEEPEVISPDEPPLTPTQTLTHQIVSHSIHFLTHPSPLIRTRILELLVTATASGTLAESALMPSIHEAWPYVLNRLDDAAGHVVVAAAALVAALAERVGEFMAGRVWGDVWPRYRRLVREFEGGKESGGGYSQEHRLYRSVLRTMVCVVRGVALRQDVLWEVGCAFRRFLVNGVNGELQCLARELYAALCVENRDVVWLVLCGTVGEDCGVDWGPVGFLGEGRGVGFEENVREILS